MPGRAQGKKGLADSSYAASKHANLSLGYRMCKCVLALSSRHTCFLGCDLGMQEDEQWEKEFLQ